MGEVYEILKLEYLLKLGLTILIVFPIGFERENKHKSAGLITHLLVAIGMSTIGIFQQELSASMPVSSFENQRIIAQAITGVGFLGAGTIIKTNGSISGLTTAASIWVVAIVGLTVGMGYYALGIYTAVVAIMLLTAIRTLFRKTKDKLTTRSK